MLQGIPQDPNPKAVVSASEANRSFSALLRQVVQGRESVRTSRRLRIYDWFMEKIQLQTTAGGRAKRWVSEARFRGRVARMGLGVCCG